MIGAPLPAAARRPASQAGFVKTALRLPPDLHAAIHADAATSGRSFNAELIAKLQGATGGQDRKPAREVTAHLIEMLSERAARGVQKYGVTLDRDDLGAGDWLQHFIEELLDAAGYAEALRRTLADSRPPS